MTTIIVSYLFALAVVLLFNRGAHIDDDDAWRQINEGGEG